MVVFLEHSNRTFAFQGHQIIKSKTEHDHSSRMHFGIHGNDLTRNGPLYTSMVIGDLLDDLYGKDLFSFGWIFTRVRIHVCEDIPGLSIVHPQCRGIV